MGTNYNLITIILKPCLSYIHEDNLLYEYNLQKTEVITWPRIKFNFKEG
jgi:hypothetical protein